MEAPVRYSKSGLVELAVEIWPNNLSRVLSVLGSDYLKHIAFPSFFVFAFSGLNFWLKGDIFPYCHGAGIRRYFSVVVTFSGVELL